MPKAFSQIGKPIFILSHPRSGTHLTIDLIRKQFPETRGWKYPWESLGCLYLSIEGFLDRRRPLSEERALALLRRSERPIVKSHVYSYSTLQQRFPAWIEWLQSEADILYVYRDVRSVMPSLHIFMQSFVPATRTDFSTFLRQPFATGANRLRYWADEVNEWTSKPDVTTLRFEDVLKDTTGAINTIAVATDMTPVYREPLLPKKVEGLWQSRLIRFTSIRPETTAIVGYYGGQRPKKWREAFTTEDLAFLEAEAGEIMQELGYNKAG